MKRFTKFFLITFLICSTSLLAQETRVIKGRIISEEDQEPLPQALIMSSNKNGVLANNDGFFLISLSSEITSVTVSYLGFFQKQITFGAKDVDLGNVSLKPNPTSLNEILITGTNQSYDDNFKGSNFFLDKKSLELSNPLNTEEMLRIVPGVNIVGDMGLSNRPNISIRGSWGRRSKKILLMEDGTPAAPAPYIAPGAYYNPVSDRVTAIEVYKGADMLRFGPNNMYGGINYITALPPQKPELRLKLVGGQRGYTTGLLSYGGTWNKLGALVEAVYKEFGGFTDNSSVQVLNLNAKIFAELSENQSLYFKVSGQYEDNQASLSSITPFTFQADPIQNPFDADRFTMRRYGLDIIHKWLPNSSLSFTSKIYATDFERDWWRQVNTVIPASQVHNYVGDQIYRDRYSYLDDADIGPEDYVRVGRILNGMESTTDSRWIFTVSGFRELMNAKWGNLENKHELEASFKLHQESYNNRFLVANNSRWARSGNPATDQEFGMWSASGFIRNEFNLDRWKITPIVRIEHVEMTQQNLLALAADPNIQDSDEYKLKNSYTIALPGTTVEYEFGSQTLFTSAYRGFIAPSKVFGFFVERNGVLTTPNQGEELNIDPELSTNLEFGWRGNFLPDAIESQVTYFNTSVQNFVAAGENELFRQPGKVNIQGIEAAISTSLLAASSRHELVLDVNATIMWTEVNGGAVEDRDLFGPIVHSQATKNEFIQMVNNNRSAYEIYVNDGQGGEELLTDQTLTSMEFDNISKAIFKFGDGFIENGSVPYTPKFNLNGRLNYKLENFSIGFTGNYVGEQYTEFANFENESADGAIGKLPSFFNMDMHLSYDLSVSGFNTFRVFVNAKNLTNDIYRSSRLNRAASGILPGGFRQTIIGVNMAF
jgi:Fe(3+) dicitrate transport protein